MTRITIIADDGTVYVDGLALAVDLATLDPEIHAVQWIDDPDGGHGEIEYKVIDGVCKPNEVITDFSPFQLHVNNWNVAKTAVDAAAAKAVATAAAARAANAAKPVNVIAN